MRVSVTCEGCHEVLPVGRTDRRYCSAACRQRSYRSRQRGEVPDPLATTTVGGGRKKITVTEKVSGTAYTLMTNAIESIEQLEHLDLSATDPTVAARARDELEIALATIRRLHAALDTAARPGDD